MYRIVRIFALYLFVGIPLFLIFAAQGERGLQLLDAIFWRAAVVIFLFLVWRAVLALENRHKE